MVALTATLFVTVLTVWNGRADVTIVVPATPDEPVVVTGLFGSDIGAAREDWPSILSVYVTGRGEVPAVLGEYTTDGVSITFTPRFPFVPDQEYRVVFSFDATHIESSFMIPNVASSWNAVVNRIYPTANELPSNLLKFYVYFSSPMRGGDVYDHVALLDESGEAVDLAFVETRPELWDPSMTRLTLICHPGRIKRGLELNERIGPPLREGETFTLRVDGLLDDAGSPMARAFDKDFVVGAADRMAPDPEAWVVHAPGADADVPLRIELGESLDHALLQRFVAVADASGSILEGTVELSQCETEWAFYPTETWAAGEYTILIHEALEDLAGNRVDGLFDAKTNDSSLSAKKPAQKLRFDVR
ncbi:MAG: hypothetical protein O7D32_02190 [bacterium]|nr:hypothetical protein [bacterium]